MPVVAAAVRRGDMNLYLSGLLGTVTAFQTVTVRTRVDGQIMKVYFTEGQMVKAGEPLVEIDKRPYEVQLAQAQGQLARDQASLTQGRQDLKRDVELLKTKSVTPQTYDAQISTGRPIRRGRQNRSGDDCQRSSCKSRTATSPPLSAGGSACGWSTWGISCRLPSQTALAVDHPASTDRRRSFRSHRTTSSACSRSSTRAKTIVIEALNRDLTAKLATGKLLAIDNQVDVTTGTVKLKAVFQNEDNLLFPNEFVSVQLLIDTQRNVVLVPSAAVQHGPNSTFAFVIKSDQTVEMRQLTVGATENDQTIVEKGLSPGELVVTEGTDKLQDGIENRNPRPEVGRQRQSRNRRLGTSTLQGRATAQAAQ